MDLCYKTITFDNNDWIGLLLIIYYLQIKKFASIAWDVRNNVRGDAREDFER